MDGMSMRSGGDTGSATGRLDAVNVIADVDG